MQCRPSLTAALHSKNKMADREKILRDLKAGGDAELASQLLDLAEGARKSRRYKVTGFLDPHEQNVAEIIAANFPNIRVELNGGFQNAERLRAAFVSEEFYGQPDFAITPLQITWDKRYYDIGHRDVLGAFMGLGCKREIMGDIVFNEEGGQIVVDTAMSNFVVTNLTKIGAATVEVREIAFADLQEKEQKIKLISSTVAALRLDAVAAAGYGVSRSRMADEIKGQNVRLNWQDAKSPSQTVKEGDIISFRSRGRVELSEVRGTTKKGRFAITLKRYI